MNEEFAHGGNIKKEASCYGVDAKKVIDFSANINPLKMPSPIKKKLTEALGLVRHYPDPYAVELTEAIAAYTGMHQEKIFAGNGAVDLIYRAVHMLCPKRTAIVIPTFSEYERASLACHAETRCIQLDAMDGFKIDVASVLQEAKGCDLLFLCNPNNPTGAYLPRDEMHFLIKKCREDNIFMLIDESFIDFLGNDHSAVDDFIALDNLILIRSLTKFFSIAGLRAGYMLSSKSIVSDIKRKSPPWSVNSIAQTAACQYLKRPSFIRDSIAYIDAQRDVLFGAIQKIKGLHVFESRCNFLFIRIEKEDMHASELKRTLLTKYRLLIRDCSDFKGLDHRYFRIAVKAKKENALLVKALNLVFYP
jgi:L-threonine-O-3-phosphate decarboxylase